VMSTGAFTRPLRSGSDHRIEWRAGLRADGQSQIPCSPKIPPPDAACCGRGKQTFNFGVIRQAAAGRRATRARPHGSRRLAPACPCRATCQPALTGTPPHRVRSRAAWSLDHTFSVFVCCQAPPGSQATFGFARAVVPTLSIRHSPNMKIESSWEPLHESSGPWALRIGMGYKAQNAAIAAAIASICLRSRPSETVVLNCRLMRAEGP
jgi:hypothetical protein